MQNRHRSTTEKEQSGIFAAASRLFAFLATRWRRFRNESEDHMDEKTVSEGGEDTFQPLDIHYDPRMDRVTINGLRFSGDVFRTWRMPTDKIYKFGLSEGGAIIVEQIVPCQACAEKFHMNRKCRTCGCTESNPCIVAVRDANGVPIVGSSDPCGWTEVDLCSACDERSGAVRLRGPLTPEELEEARRRQMAEIDLLLAHVHGGVDPIPGFGEDLDVFGGEEDASNECAADR
jgi:hypothetical protein